MYLCYIDDPDERIQGQLERLIRAHYPSLTENYEKLKLLYETLYAERQVWWKNLLYFQLRGRWGMKRGFKGQARLPFEGEGA